MYISIGHVAKLAGVSKSSIRRWEADNYLLPDYRTRGNPRRYLYTRILEFLGLKKRREQTEVFIYGRVSSSRQKEDLKIQDLKDHVANNNWSLSGVYKDIGSGLNDNRKGLLKLIRDIPKKMPDYVLCSYKDRVARFGTRLLEEFCDIYNVKLVETRILESSEEEKLAHSIIAILTSFSGKLYRSRRGKTSGLPLTT